VVDEDFTDTTLGDLQEGTRNHRIAGEREHIVHYGAFTVRPALNGVRGSESVDDLHEPPLSHPRTSTSEMQPLSSRNTARATSSLLESAPTRQLDSSSRIHGEWVAGLRMKTAMLGQIRDINASGYNFVIDHESVI
jgi:hypothetical protein